MSPAPPLDLAVTGHRPEDDVLLGAARAIVRNEDDARGERLTEGKLDWDYLVRKAVRHGLLPLLHRYLKSHPEGVPETIQVQLQERFRAHSQRSLLLCGELLEVLDLFRENEILAIPFKGPTLAVFAYGDVSLRQYLDLDMLVRERDVVKARDLLASRGYRPRVPLSWSQERVLFLSEWEYAMVDDKRNLAVELHWGFVPKRLAFALDIERLQSRLAHVSLCGRRIATPSPEDSLLILCVHGARHIWERLGWLCDVARLLAASNGMDWNRVSRQAGELGCRRMMLLGLALAKDLVEGPVPEEILRQARQDAGVAFLAGQIRTRIFRDEPVGDDVITRFHFQMRMLDRLRDRAYHCLDIAFTPRVEDCAVVSLPDALFPLYYLIHPLRVLVQYGWLAARGRANRGSTGGHIESSE